MHDLYVLYDSVRDLFVVCDSVRYLCVVCDSLHVMCVVCDSVITITILKHILERNFPEKGGLKGLHNLHARTHTNARTQTHTPQFLQSTAGGGGGHIAPTINIKYRYNENNTGKTKQTKTHN